MHKKIPDSYSKREGGNPGNSGLLSQQKMVVHYPSTVLKNNYDEHEVTGKTNNVKKKKNIEHVGMFLHRRRFGTPHRRCEASRRVAGPLGGTLGPVVPELVRLVGP